MMTYILLWWLSGAIGMGYIVYREGVLKTNDLPTLFFMSFLGPGVIIAALLHICAESKGILWRRKQ